jgi:uncharacterized protein YndB with AHSA1/START domain
MTDNSIRKSLFLAAAPDIVWAWLTDPDKLAQGFHRPEKPLIAGDALAMFGTESGDRLIWGQVIAARAPEYLEYTFTIKPMGDAVSSVKWTLAPVPGGTRLSLEHSGLPEGAAAFGLLLALDKGWDGHIARMRDELDADLQSAA